MLTESPEQTTQSSAPSPFHGPEAPILISYAEDGAEWFERLADHLVRQNRNARIYPMALGTSGKAVTIPPEDGPLVALITDQYLRSKLAADEMELHQFRTGELIFPLLVNVEEEQARKWMPQIPPQYFLPADRRPLVAREDPDTEMGIITVQILESIGHPVPFKKHQAQAESIYDDPFAKSQIDPAVEVLLSGYSVFGSVRNVFAEAAAYAASAAPPTMLSTSLLLLTVADQGQVVPNPLWTGDWLRSRMGQRFEETQAFYFARKNIPNKPHRRTGVAGLSEGLRVVLDQARDLAERTGNSEIRVRHLLAAMLTDPRPQIAGGLTQLRTAEMDVDELRADFYDFVRGYGDDDQEWGKVLLGNVEAARRLSGFDADDSRSADFLDVTPDATAFAELIAARTVTPPLSIGLFGEWGSGKTFFMRRLQSEVNRLAGDASRLERMQRDLPFYKRIVQIEFNAWHYVEGNLWASLVQHIFDNLAFADEPRPSVSQELQNHYLTQLGVEKAAEAQAQRQIDAAAAAVKAAGDEVDKARKAYDDEAVKLAELSAKNALSDLVLRPEVRTAAKGALAELGFGKVGDSAAELGAALGDARRMLGRARSVSGPLLYAPDRARRMWALLAALVVGPALALGFAWLEVRSGREEMVGITAATTGLAGFLSSGAVWVRSQLARADKWIRQIDQAQREYDDALAAAAAKTLAEVRKAEEQLRLLEADYEAAKRKQADAERRVLDAQQALKEASVTQLLTDFVETRANSSDYRKHLGTLALVRNDFQRLSEIIEEDNWRLAPAVPGENTTRRALGKFETLDEENRELKTRINRIVLYIDDLDRCPPEKVVEVLQAVHLLLAFPLFVVVVGVDARWVVRSVETRYRELLRKGVEGDADRDIDEFQALFGSATAHDYLEKIFQVPFWLRPMTDDACERMVRGLLASSLAASSPADAGVPGATGGERETRESARPTGANTGPRGETAGAGNDPRAAETADTTPGGTGKASDAAGTAASGVGEEAKDAGSGAGAEDAKDAGSGSKAGTAGGGAAEEPGSAAAHLEIYPVEVNAMADFAPLLGRSPRALKRFVNVYRLIKATLTPYERRVFLNDGETLPNYRAVLFLLAVDTGAPMAAPAFFRELRALSASSFFRLDAAWSGGPLVSDDQDAAPATLAELVRRLDADPDLRHEQDWARLRRWLTAGDGGYTLPDELGRLGRWVPRVSRFSFHTGRMVPPRPTASSQTSTGPAPDGPRSGA